MLINSYLRWLIAGLVIWTCVFFSVTWVIDPYGVSPVRVTIPRINEYKVKRVDIDRIIKPYEVWRFQPKTVFLGTSRIHQSIDPTELDGTRFAPAYNASIPASSLGLNISHPKQYIDLNKNLKTVVIELFLYNFLGQGQDHPPKDFNEFLRNSFNLHISNDAFWASIQTLGYNLLTPSPVYEIKPSGYFYYPPGHNAKGPFDGYPAGIWKLHETRPKGLKLFEPAFDSVKNIASICEKNRIECIFILTPNHAYDDWYLEATNSWGAVEEWLTRLSDLPVTLVSFSQPNRLTHESVDDSMEYWYDPYHFSLRMGEEIQHSLTGASRDGVPGNFSVILTPSDIKGHVDARRSAIQHWANQNQPFINEFILQRKLHDDRLRSL
jgi:hypothetical protein